MDYQFAQFNKILQFLLIGQNIRLLTTNEYIYIYIACRKALTQVHIARPTGLHSINASRITSPWNVKDTDAVDVISILRRVEIPRIVSTISTPFLCIYIYMYVYTYTEIAAIA